MFICCTVPYFIRNKGWDKFKEYEAIAYSAFRAPIFSPLFLFVTGFDVTQEDRSEGANAKVSKNHLRRRRLLEAFPRHIRGVQH